MKKQFAANNSSAGPEIIKITKNVPLNLKALSIKQIREMPSPGMTVILNTGSTIYVQEIRRLFFFRFR